MSNMDNEKCVYYYYYYWSYYIIIIIIELLYKYNFVLFLFNINKD